MQIRASVPVVVKVALLLVAIATGNACSHASGKLMVDCPALLGPYHAPDIDEITGVDSSDEPEAPPAAGAGSAQNPHR